MIPLFDLILTPAQLAISNRGLETTVYRPLGSDREEKSVHHQRGDPSFFLFMGLRLYGVDPSFRTYGVYPFPLFSQENGIHHSFFLLCDGPRGRATDLGRDMGGAKRMGGGKRTRERALPKILGPLQKSSWSALSWFCTGITERGHLKGWLVLKDTFLIFLGGVQGAG